MSLRFLDIILFLVLALQVFSQPINEKEFIHYTTKNGLNDNYITSVEQDEQGNIWIATETGLNMYDGYAFADHSPTLNSNSISGNIIKLKKFPANKLGIITRNGFYLLNTTDFTVKKYVIPDHTAFNIYLNFAWDAAMLADHSFAVTTTTGFYVFDEPGALKFRYDEYKPADVSKKTIRYGRDIFPINDHENIIYFNNYGTAHYNPAKKLYRMIDPSEPDLSFFSPPPIPTAGHWLTKFQLNSHEFIFIPAAKDSITYYDHNTKKIIKSPLPFHTINELNYQSKITMLSDSSFVLNGGNQGFWIFQLNRKTGKITCNGKKYLPGNKINCLFVDKEKRLWIGTPEGLLQQRLNPPLLQVFTLTPGLLKDTVQKDLSCIYRYKDKLYAGRFARKSGLVILDTATMKTIATVDFFGSDNEYNEVMSVEMYHKDTLWLGTTGGLTWLDTKTNRYGKLADDKRFPKEVEKLNMLSPIGKDGYAWLCAFLTGTAARYNPGTGKFQFFTTDTEPRIPFTKVKRIVHDVYGDVWFSGHALARWNTRQQTFDTLITVYDGPNKFNDNILTITADDKGSLWLHNVENGLLQYQVTNKRFIHYGVNKGLPSDYIESLSPVVNNIFWIAQRTSLSRFDITTKKIKSYGYHDGLPLHKPTGFSIYYDTATNFGYLLCKNDIVRFDFLPRDGTNNSSELFIQKVLVNNDKAFFNPSGNLSLKLHENNLVIHYTVIDYESGDDYNFAYRLGTNQPWINLGKQRNIILANLGPGKHSLELKATAISGVEKTREFNFTIAPPFWKTAWFIVLALIGITAFLYLFYRIRIRQIRQRSNVDKMLAQTEMKALHAQMNPHFIFNCLNSIREMILHNENEQASLYLSKFARLIRITLNQSSKPFVSLTDTIDYLERYIEMEKIRTDHFQYAIKTGEDLQPDEVLLPPMLIQPFIENAIWHGAAAKKEMTINISFTKKENELICVVEDNGIGIEESLKRKENPPTEPSVGISNIRQRIELLNEKYKLQSAIRIEDKSVLPGNSGTGTIVTLHLPIKTNKSLWTS